MSYSKEVKLSLKVMINKEKTKVLFAEADSDFIDVLLSFVTLPLGTIVRILEKHYGDKAPVFGSLNTLYKGLANLDSVHFWTEGGKQMLLNPRSSFEAECRNLKINVDDTKPTKYFRCGKNYCSYPRHSNISMYYDDARCSCGGTISTEVGLTVSQAAVGDVGVFTKNTVSFLISDDLRILPYSTGFVHTLSNIGITDTEGAELRNVSFGFHEIMDLLKGLILSPTPLSDIILNNRRCAAAKPESGILLPPFAPEVISSSKKMSLKVMVQKSTNKLLFAQAEDDFIDLLFSFLTIPLGGVVCLLNGNTSLKNIDNLNSSIRLWISDKYMKTPDIKNRLIKPKLPHCYISKNQILPLVEESAPVLYYDRRTPCLSPNETSYGELITSFKSPKGEENYVKGPRTYMITEDLVVTHCCMASSFSIINRLNIPMSDVKELDFFIGLQEALSILKASLTSPSALTSALVNSMVKKEQKQRNKSKGTKARKLRFDPSVYANHGMAHL